MYGRDIGLQSIRKCKQDGPQESAASRPHGGNTGGMVPNMTLASDRDLDRQEFAIEDIYTGVHASGFGQIGDGRSFSFHVERQQLVVEVYRSRLSGPVPLDEDVVALSTRKLTDIDLTDERSLSAAVRDAVADAQPVSRIGR